MSEEYKADFISYHSDFESFSDESDSQKASLTPPNHTSYCPPQSVSVSAGGLTFSQAPMSYRARYMEGICKEQFVQTALRFVSRGTSTYAETSTTARSVQVPSFQANSGAFSDGISMAESVISIALMGQAEIEAARSSELPVQTRNKAILQNLNQLKASLIPQGTRETKIGFLMEKCIRIDNGYIALVATKILENELSEVFCDQQNVQFPLNRRQMFQFILLFCDLSFNIKHFYTKSTGSLHYSPRDFIFLPRNICLPPRLLLFSQHVNCESESGTTKSPPKRPYLSNYIFLLTVPALDGFCEVCYQPTSDFTLPVGRLAYRVAHRQSKSTIVIGLTEYGLLHTWEYNESNHEVSAYVQEPFKGELLALSIYSIVFTSKTSESKVLIHMNNGIFLVLPFITRHSLDSEIARLLDACEPQLLQRIIPGTAINDSIYYNPVHAAVRAVRRFSQASVRADATVHTGVTCIFYTDNTIECFGSGIADRIAVYLYNNGQLSPLMGTLPNVILACIYKEIKD